MNSDVNSDGALSGDGGGGLEWTGRLGRPSVFLHPLVIFSGVWVSVLFLYSLHLSYILRYPTAVAALTVLRIWIPLAIAVAFVSFLDRAFSKQYGILQSRMEPNLDRFRRRLRACFIGWCLVTIVEIAASGGVPLVWALTGNSKTYVDFGIPSVHGFMNSLQVAIAVSYVALFLIERRTSDLKIPAFFLVWCVIIINRNMLLVTLLEAAVLYVRFRGLKASTVVKLVAGVLGFVLFFGVIGDIRQGDAGAIRALAQPTEDYPDWLPSGALWAYIYITTPINNLVYNTQETRPLYDPRFPSTVSTLFPSVVRSAIYGDQLGDAESGQLVVSAFNVSTAYIGPYRDFGYWGTTLFSFFIGGLCQVFWFRRDLCGILMMAVTTQCLILTLFFDHFFYLPVITQLGWAWFFFLPRFRILPRRIARSSIISEGGELHAQS